MGDVGEEAWTFRGLLQQGIYRVSREGIGSGDSGATHLADLGTNSPNAIIVTTVQIAIAADP